MKRKLEFAPGCFDDWEGTQEELDAFMEELTEMFQSDDFIEKAEKLSPEEEQKFFQNMQRKIDKRGTKLN